MSYEKPLNPNANYVPLPPLAARAMSASLYSTDITDHVLVPQGQPVVVAPPLAHYYGHPVVSSQYQNMQPTAALVMGYTQPDVFHHHHPPHTSISPPHPMDQNLQAPIDSSENDDRLDSDDPEWENEDIDGNVENGGGVVQLQWRVKRDCRIGGVPFPPTLEEAERSNTTTLMVKNLMRSIQLKDMLLALDDHCTQQNRATVDPADWSMFDFLYLPMDFRKHSKRGKMSNLGYAFVNFTTPRAAFKFYQQHHESGGYGDETKKSKITAAHVQGREALVEQFSRKVFRCNSPDFLPLVFSKPRDGFNRESEGALVGRFVEGKPRKM